jgi:hypothetical protein
MSSTNSTWMTREFVAALAIVGVVAPHAARSLPGTAQRTSTAASEAHQRHRRGEINPTLRAIKHPADGPEMRPSQPFPVIELLELAS